MNIVRLDDRRAPHPRRTQRLARMTRAFPPPHDLDAAPAHLRRAHQDPALRAQILAIMQAQVA